MNTITIPKNLIKNDDLVIVPRKEYENLLSRQKMIPVARLSLSEKKLLEKARKEMDRGEYLTLKELEHDLGIANRKSR